LFALRKERMDRDERSGSGIKFANGREVRQSLESVEERIAARVGDQSPTRKRLVSLTTDDLPFEELTGIAPAAVPMPALRWSVDGGPELASDALPLIGRFPELTAASRARLFALLPPARWHEVPLASPPPRDVRDIPHRPPCPGPRLARR